MHALRLLRKRFCYALTTSQAHLDFSRRGNPSFAYGFLLAGIGQAQAVPTRERIAGVIQRRDPASTMLSVGIDIACKPRAMTAEVAFGRCDRNALVNKLAVAASALVASRAIAMGLNERGIRSPRRVGEWKAGSVAHCGRGCEGSGKMTSDANPPRPHGKGSPGLCRGPQEASRRKGAT
jgi:hypothetical protein